MSLLSLCYFLWPFYALSRLRKVFRNSGQCNQSIAATEWHTTDFKGWVPRWCILGLCSPGVEPSNRGAKTRDSASQKDWIPQLACEKLQFLANQAVKHVIETTDNIGFKTLTNFDAHQEGFALPCIPQPLEDDSQGSALRGQFKPQQMVLLLFVWGLYFQIIQNYIAVVHLPLILINRSTAGSGNFTMRRLITNPQSNVSRIDHLAN